MATPADAPAGKSAGKLAGRYRRPISPEQRAKAADQREAKLAGLHRELAEQVHALTSGPQWRAWLEVAARFHNYSFNNTLLILAQQPDATQVAGYTLWQQLGRRVGKGEHGIAILAPVTRRPDSDEDTAEQNGSAASATPAGTDTTAAGTGTTAAGPLPRTVGRRVVGFRPAYVWDISQTTGDPLPTPPTPVLLAGHAPPGLWDTLAAQCHAAGYTVTREAISGAANGYTDFATHAVVVRDDVDDAQAVKTLAHELAHVLMHNPAEFDDGQTRACRGDQEVEAESVAFLVAADHGLDTSDYTFAYVARWAVQTGDVDAAVRASGARVLATAHRIIDKAASGETDTLDQAAAGVKTLDRPAVDADQLAARAAAGADRTATLRAAATAPPAPTTEQTDRLHAANAAAAAFFADHLASSWAAGYLADRLGVAATELPPGRVGYATPGWTGLTDHLRRGGFTDTDLLGAGLATRTRTGRLVDRFRDRLMFPIRDHTDGRVVGFVGRRHPDLDQPGAGATSDQSRTPKYLNTSTGPLYVEGEQLFGLAEGRGVLDRGGLAVLVEGPLDALAVDLAAAGTMAGVAPLGTALTPAQASQLAQALGAGSDRVVVATDPDPAGRHAADRAYQLLTAAGLDPRGAALPAGLDPADTAQLHGPAALIDRLAAAAPLTRELIADGLAARDLRWDWPEHRLAAAAMAAGIITQAPPQTWPREVDAAAEQTGLPLDVLYRAVLDRVGDPPDQEADAWGRLRDRDRRDDLHRGEHNSCAAADYADTSCGRHGLIRPAIRAARGNPAGQDRHPAQRLTVRHQH